MRKVVGKKDSRKFAASQYSDFCRMLKEGDILYNVNKTTKWGDYFLVAAKISTIVNKTEFFSILLLGLKNDSRSLVFAGTRVDLTPQKASFVPYLKVIGNSKFSLYPLIEEYNVNNGLAVVYKNTDLWKFSSRIPVRKPRVRKYGEDGKPIVKPTNNK